MDQENAAGPDLVVAGAGGGLAAALRAAQLGLSVLVVEADGHFQRGNNTSMSTAMLPGAGTHWQTAAGIDDSPHQFASDLQAKTHGESDDVLTSALTNVSARLVEWLGGDIGLPLSLVTDFNYPGHSRLRCHSIPGHSGQSLLTSLVHLVRNSELIDLMVPARLVDIQVNAGQVVGATVETPSGLESIPTKSVLMATNGFGADKRLVQQHIPEIADAVYHGGSHSLGDALRIGEKLGAATGFLDAYQGHAALADPSASLASWATVMLGGFLVNRAGERYGDESTGYSEYASESLKHADGQSWIILDAEIYESCLSFADFQNVDSSGGIMWADSVESLAEATGIDAQGLSETFNSVVGYKSGKAVDPFGRTVWGNQMDAMNQIGAIAVRPALFHTQGGLRVDENARVLTTEGKGIEGLYASGGAAMGISGHGASGYLAGNGLLPAFGLAFLAAEDVHARIQRENE